MPLFAAGSAPWRMPESARLYKYGGVTMKRFLFFSLIFLISSACFAQQGTRLPDNKELVTKARSFYVDSDTFYMKREALESSLLGQDEFKAWDLQVTNR